MTSSQTRLSLEAVQRLVASRPPISVYRLRRGQIGVIVGWVSAPECVGMIVMRRQTFGQDDDLVCVLNDDWWPDFFDPQQRRACNPDEYTVVLVTAVVRAAVMDGLNDSLSKRPKRKVKAKNSHVTEHLRPPEFDDDDT